MQTKLLYANGKPAIVNNITNIAKWLKNHRQTDNGKKFEKIKK